MLALNLVTRFILTSLFLVLITIDTIEFSKTYSEFYGQILPTNLLAYPFKLIQVALALAIALSEYERKIIRTIVWGGIWLVFSIFISLPGLIVETVSLDALPHIALAVIFQVSTFGFALAVTECANVQTRNHHRKRKHKEDRSHASAFAMSDIQSDEEVISSFLRGSIARLKGQNIGARDFYNAYSRYCHAFETKPVVERLFSGIVKANNIAHKRQSKGSFYLDVMFTPAPSKGNISKRGR